jgi:tetratricopeptide (TPR) repeat protein
VSLLLLKRRQTSCIAIAAAVFSLTAGTPAAHALPSSAAVRKPDAIESMEKKAREYSNRKQWGKAQIAYRQILEERQKQWGRDDIRLVGPLNDVVRVTCVDGKCSNTVPYLNDLLSIRKKKFGVWNADVATTYALMAEANEKMQRYPEAIKNFRESIKIRDRVFGKTAAMSVRTRMNVIRVALKNKDKAGARAMLLECQTLLSAQRNPQPELEKLLSYYSAKI